MLRHILKTACIISVCFVLSCFPLLTVIAWAQDKTSAENEQEVVCKDPISASGRTNSIESVASLSAVIAWMVLARREGQEFEFWQNAQAKSVKCKKNKILFLCEAAGKPCNKSKRM